MVADLSDEWFRIKPYLDVKLSPDPTILDQSGYDGLYVKDIRIKWWGYLVIFVGGLIILGKRYILENADLT